MNRNFSIGILIFCFSLSSVNATLASEMVSVSPIIVQPEDLREMKQQILEQDRINRDQELAIRGLVDENQQLTNTALAIKQDSTLQKINQTLSNYRDSLVSRDRARIEANSQTASKYYDLIKLTEDVDDIKDAQGLKDLGKTIRLKSDVIEEKYKVLTELKNEMIALNEKLKGEKAQQKSDKVDLQQADKIQTLTQRLSEMDQKIAHYDEALAQKDQQIAQLKDDLAKAKAQAQVSVKSPELKLKEKVIQSQRDQLFKDQSDLDAKNSQVDQLVQRLSQLQAQSPAPIKDDQADQLRQELSQKQAQVDLLKSELEDKIAQEKNQSQAPIDNDRSRKLTQELSQKQAQVDSLKSELEDKIAQEKNQREVPAQGQVSQRQVALLKSELEDKLTEVTALKNKINHQNSDLKAKDGSIHWLNQILSVTKNKAEYYKLSAQEERLSLQGVREEMQEIRDGFTKRFKDYDQLEQDIISLRSQVAQLGEQLSQKQQELGSLKSQLADKTTAAQAQAQQEIQQDQSLKAQLQNKEKEIVSLKAEASGMLNKADEEKKDDRLKLAKQLIDLQQQEAVLLEEKDRLRVAQNTIFDRRFSGFENKMNGLVTFRKMQTADLQNRIDELNDELEQRQQQAGLLNTELRNKIAEEQNQSVLAEQIHDLKSQVQDKEDQIAAMKAEAHSGQETQVQVDALKQRLADQQNKEDSLKQELDSKNAQSVEMTRLLSDYQRKLEDKNNAYNEELRKVLSSKNDQAAKLKEKETQDLSLSMVQQEVTDKEINEDKLKIVELQTINDKQGKELTSLKTDLALAHQQLAGMPSSDEIEFLRTGLKKATLQLSQKDGMLSQIKANADEYEKEFKAQTKEFQSLKEQLQDAYEQINRKNEDLKYKNLEIIRLKERSAVKEGDLEDQIKALTSKLGSAGKGSKVSYVKVKIKGNNAEALKEQLESANAQIKDLDAQLNQFILPSKKDPLREKLKQALDKINEQGRFIDVLVKKLQDCGQAGNLTSYTGKE